ncbi:MAG: collagen binding domain-containing protein, partial [Suilimivivens sp.]
NSFKITGNSSKTFSELPKYTESGTPIQYRAIETKVNGVAIADETTGAQLSNGSKSYQVNYVHETGKTSITNTLVTIPIEITKIWDDNSNIDGVRPENISLTLYADYDGAGSAERKEVSTSQYSLNWEKTGNIWTATITGLPRYAADGNTEIIYSLEEADINRYIGKIETVQPTDENEKWKFTVTNTLDLLITLKKQDKEDDSPLSGVTFEFYPAQYNSSTAEYERSGERIAFYTTDSTGMIHISIKETGIYELTETSTVAGYELGTPFDFFFEVKDENLRQTLALTTESIDSFFILQSGEESLVTADGLDNARKKGTLMIYKQDGDTSADLDGVTFTLYKESEGNIFTNAWDFITGKKYKVYHEATADSTGVTTIEDLEWGNYKLVEKKALDGYKLDSTEYFFTVNRNNVESPIVLTAGDCVYGLPAGDYEIEELTAPFGYKTAESVAFTIDEGGVIYKDKEKRNRWENNQVIMQDELIEISLKKTDGEECLLTGAEFSVTGTFASGGSQVTAPSVISNLTINNFTQELKGKLIASEEDSEGTGQFIYELKETLPPEGYALPTETVFFKLTKEGKVELLQPPEFADADNEGSIPTIVVGNKKDVCSFEVTKKFEKDEQWKESIRPSKVTFQLYAQIVGESEKVAVRDPVTIEVNNDTDSYSYTYQNLPTHFYDYDEAGLVEAKKLTYFVEETAVEPSAVTVYYDVEYSSVEEEGNVFSQTITNTAGKLLPSGTLKISKTNVGGARDAMFRIQVTFGLDENKSIFKDAYKVYKQDDDADDTNDVLDRTVTASDGYVEIRGGEYATLELPAQAVYHIEEILNEVNGTKQYIPEYTDQAGTIIGNVTVAALVLNKTNIYTSIENNTENEGESYPDDSKPRNAGGIVGVVTGITSDEEAYDKVDYQEGKLSVYWMPEEDWQCMDSFTVTYREYDGSVNGGTDHSVTVTDFLREDGTVKEISDNCYDELKSRYPDMEIEQDEDGTIILRLANTVDGMPYLSKVDVTFLPTIAVINTTAENAGGQVRVETGQFSDIADGKGIQGEKRYPETKVYAKADKGYVIDLSEIEIGNVNAITTKEPAAMFRRLRAAFEKVKLTLDEQNAFRIQLPYTMADQNDSYALQGKIEILRTGENGAPTEIAMVLDDLPIPIDIGIPFVKEPEPVEPSATPSTDPSAMPNVKPSAVPTNNSSDAGGTQEEKTVDTPSSGLGDHETASIVPAKNQENISAKPVGTPAVSGVESDKPDTGDDSPFRIWLMILMVAICLSCVSIRKLRNKK